VHFLNGRMVAYANTVLNVVDVDDVAEGHALALERGRNGHNYILGGENHSLREVFDLLADAAGWRPRALLRLPHWALHVVAAVAELRARWKDKEPYPSVQAARMLRYYWFHRSDRAMRELGHASRPLPQTLADTYAWHVVNGVGPPRGLKRWWLRSPQPAEN